MMTELVSLRPQLQTQQTKLTPNLFGSNFPSPSLPYLSHSGTSHVQTPSSLPHNVNPTLGSNPFWVESKVNIKVFNGKMDVESLKA